MVSAMPARILVRWVVQAWRSHRAAVRWLGHPHRPAGQGQPTGGQAEALQQAFRKAERQGFLLSFQMRLVILAILTLVFAVMQPWHVAMANTAMLLAFALLGWLPYRYAAGKSGRAWVPYACVIVDMLLLIWVLIIYNPLVDPVNDPVMMFRFSNITFFFLFIALTALTLSPKLVLASGAAGILAWGGGFLLVAATQPADVIHVPATVTGMEAAELEGWLARILAPQALLINPRVTETTGLALVAAVLAAAAARARGLVIRQALVARQRANLARHFSPTLIADLQNSDQPFAAPRQQTVAVLFADIVGFTALAEDLGPVETITLLRAIARRLEEAVFAHHGTLEKFLGDGIMVTFGTPHVGPNDAAHALACGHALLDAMEALNQARRARGQDPVRLSVGVHYGPVVLGDVGSERHLEFAVLGDVVNVASRIEAMTRTLGCRYLATAAALHAAREQPTDDVDVGKAVEMRRVRLPGRSDHIDVAVLA